MPEILTDTQAKQSAGFIDKQIKETFLQAGHTPEQAELYFGSGNDSNETSVLQPDLYTDKKMFTELQIVIGILLLSLPAFYLRYKNYRAVGEIFWARFFLFLGFFYIGIVTVSRELFSSTTTLAISFFFISIVLFSQGGLRKKHRENGGQYHSYITAIKTVVPLVILSWVCIVLVTYGIFLIDKHTDLNLLDETKNFVKEDKDTISEENQPLIGGPDLVLLHSVPEHWLLFSDTELSIQFYYPPEWGEVVVEQSLGVPTGSGPEHVNCTPEKEISNNVACTGALVGFLDTSSTFRPFLAIHGKYMQIAPQGGWWGFLSLPTEAAVWSENSLMLNDPSTRLYRSEHGGDMNVQFLTLHSPSISHSVVASAFTAGRVSKEMLITFDEHLQTIPPPPDYMPNSGWEEKFTVYQRDIEAMDIASDQEVQAYLQMLKTLSVVNESN